MNGIFDSEISNENIIVREKTKKEIVVSLKKKDWDTKFFEKKTGIIETKDIILNNYDLKEICSIFDTLIEFAKEQKYKIIEYNLNTLGSLGILVVPYLEDIGFITVHKEDGCLE